MLVKGKECGVAGYVRDRQHNSGTLKKRRQPSEQQAIPSFGFSKAPQENKATVSSNTSSSSVQQVLHLQQLPPQLYLPKG